LLDNNAKELKEQSGMVYSGLSFSEEEEEERACLPTCSCSWRMAAESAVVSTVQSGVNMAE
jgi:hypothetical protein